MNTMTLKRDPRPRKDGTCVVCKKQITISPRRGLDPALYIDPFCSGICARKWHKITDQ